MFAKPHTCVGCALSQIGTGFVFPEGDCTNGVLIVGEAAGANEAMDGWPFREYAPAGSMLERAIKQCGFDRRQFGVYNILACQPPQNALLGEAYELPAISHCTKHHLAKVYNDHYKRPKVILALGAIATRTLTGLTGERLTLDLLRGFPLRPGGIGAEFLSPDTIIIPSYHPSYLVQGQHPLLLVLQRDLRFAVHVAERLKAQSWEWEYKPTFQTHCTHFELKQVLSWLRQNPNHPLSVDFETVGSGDEDTDIFTTRQDITQVNLSLGPKHALVVDYDTQTRGVVWDIIACTQNPKLGHNIYGFDMPVAKWNGFEFRGSRLDDTMQSFHFMYSDLPGTKGGGKNTKANKAGADDEGAFAPLQFCASFYGYPLPWKHLYKLDPHLYGAYDADSAYWVRNGTFKDLGAFGIFEAYDEFVRELRYELEEMEERGISCSSQGLRDLSAYLGGEIKQKRNLIQSLVPTDLKPIAAIKKPTKALKDLAEEMQTQVPSPEHVAFHSETLSDIEKTFMERAAFLRVEDNEGGFTSLGYKIAKFEFYNQKCICLSKSFVADAIPECKLCDGKGLTRRATKTLKCQACASAKEYCEACLGTGLVATAKAVRVKKPKKKTKRELLEEQQQVNFEFQAAEAVAEATTEETALALPACVTHAWTKDEQGKVVCLRCSVSGTKAKLCLCRKSVSSDCLSCGGTGKSKVYTDKDCKCRLRFVPAKDCHRCYGTGIFTGSAYLWAKIKPFNVNSPKQMMAYANARGYHIPMNSKRKVAMNKETIAKMAKSTKDPLFVEAGKTRELTKIKGSYADSWLVRLKEQQELEKQNVAAVDVTYSVSPDGVSNNSGNVPASLEPTLEDSTLRPGTSTGGNSVDSPATDQSTESADTSLVKPFFAVSQKAPKGEWSPEYWAELFDFDLACRDSNLATIHTQFQFKPATQQLSSKSPNVQVAPNESKYGELATRFRTCIEAPKGYTIIEHDYKSFHALTLGYEAQCPDYIRLARLDCHSFLAANMLQLPGCQTCLQLPDVELKQYLNAVKKQHEGVRNGKAKPAILGYGFGMGAGKLFDLNPESFANFEEARYTIDMLNACFPKPAQYRLNSPEQAHRQRYLINAFGAIRWFMNVKSFDSQFKVWKHGRDWEKSIAFRPASNAFCIMKRAMLRLRAKGFTRRWNLVNNIHDALLFICPDKHAEECLWLGKEELERPVPQIVGPDGKPFYCEVESKFGKVWAKMEEYKFAPAKRPSALTELHV